MDLKYEPEHEEFRDEVRSFLERHASAAPVPGDLDYKSETRLKWQQLLISEAMPPEPSRKRMAVLAPSPIC